MANPYHDGAGKFCSREEMQAEIQRLAKTGDFKAYSELRKSYENIIKRFGGKASTNESTQPRIGSGFSHNGKLRFLSNPTETEITHAVVSVEAQLNTRNTVELHDSTGGGKGVYTIRRPEDGRNNSYTFVLTSHGEAKTLASGSLADVVRSAANQVGYDDNEYEPYDAW